MLAWDDVTRLDVLHAMEEEYDELGADRFFSEHGFADGAHHPADTCALYYTRVRSPRNSKYRITISRMRLMPPPP
jgi:hypothetical protein